VDKKRSLDFKGFQIKQNNVLLAWEKVKSALGVDKQEKIENKKVELPKTEAFVVVDEDFERLYHEKNEKEYTVSRQLQRVEYGVEHTVTHVRGFTRFFWDEKTGNLSRVMIFIRDSVFSRDHQDIYRTLEHEMRHILIDGLFNPVGNVFLNKKKK